MKSVIFFCSLWLAVSACAQADKTPQAAVDAGSSTGRIYVNKLLGFSCELPQDWISFSEMLRSASPKAAVDRERALLRSQGVLLVAVEFPQQFRNVPIYISSSPQGLSSVPGLKTESLAVVVEQLSTGTPEDLSQILESELGRQKLEDQNIKPSTNEEFVVDGEKLLRTSFFSPKNRCYTSVIVCSRAGYAMKFFLRAKSEKDLGKLMKFMDKVHFGLQ